MKRYPGLFLISRLQSDLDRLFEEAQELGEAGIESGDWLPQIDVVESEDRVRILVEVPGVAPGDLEVEVEGDRITISGTKSAPAPPPEQARYHRMERSRGDFRREIRLPQTVNTAAGTARLADGLLVVDFPRIADQRRHRHRLPIRTADGAEDE